ncbi:MAG: MFS transporter [Pseudomonadota bacterium]
MKSNTQSTGHLTAGPYSTSSARWSLVALIMTGMVFSLVDRQIIALLVEPIKADLGLTDTQFSILLGPAFVVFYITFGLPFGWLADRLARRYVIAIGVTVWSFATVMCGAAWSFVTLAAARAGVGAGEAALMPSSMSIISDLFSRERLPFVTSIFSVSMHIGSAAAMLIGGVILSVLGDVESIRIPLFGDVAPWQFAFIAVGAPGFIVAFIFLLIPEPPRRRERPRAEVAAPQQTDGPGLVAFIKLNTRTIGAQFISASLLTISTYAFISWSAAYLMRAQGLSNDNAAFLLGVIALISGPAGTIGGGALSTWLLKQKGRVDAPWLVMILSAVGVGVFGTITFLSPVQIVVFVMLGVSIFFGSLYIGIIHAAIQMIAPDHLRGQLAALLVLFMTGIGATSGPVIVALITDYVFKDPMKVGYSILLVTLFVSFSVCALLGSNLRQYRESYARAEAA